MLDIFGPNVSVVCIMIQIVCVDVANERYSQSGWLDWQRQRKIVASSFNENTNKLVWSESLAQARDMLRSWTCSGQSGAAGVAKDTRTLSLDVLAATGFRKSYKFRSSTDPSPGEAQGYRESLAITMDNALLMMLVPPSLLSLPFIPKAWARVGQATKDFRQYMMDMFNEEKSLLDAGKAGTGNLMSSLVRSSEDEKKQDITTNAGGPRGLTIGEILGNTFVINFAGHDTTANTLAYAMLLLAAYPETQDWIGAELKEIIGDSNSEVWDYEELFPRLKRCQAVLVSRPPQMVVHIGSSH